MSISLSADTTKEKKKPIGYTKDSGLPIFSFAMLDWWCWHWPESVERPAFYRTWDPRAPFYDIFAPAVRQFLSLSPQTSDQHPDGQGPWCQYELNLLREFQGEVAEFWTKARAWDKRDRWYLLYLLSQLRCLPPLVYQTIDEARAAAHRQLSCGSVTKKLPAVRGMAPACCTDI